ncbi:MAG: DegT/DnrJ/EryC1/StrS family aminotransferase [Rhodanobacteraceae bacterium]
MSAPTIPFNALDRQHDPVLAQEIADAIDRVTRSGWYVLGNEVAAFEREFALYCGVAHAVGVGNGSDALELALAALRLPLGTRVAVAPNAAMYATLAILSHRCEPAFVDVDLSTSGIDPGALGRELESGVGAVIVTHLYGRLGEIEAIVAQASAKGIPVIEDCAQAHGASRNGRRAGSFGSLACFSFYPTKNLGALGDGGAIVTTDAALAERVRQLRQYGWAGKYDVEVAHGRNSRLDELQAAVLRRKLPRLDAWNARRREIARRYREGIAHAAIETPALRGDDDIAHLYVVRSGARDALREHLAANGVRTDVHYPIPDHRQRLFDGRYDALELPVAEALAVSVLSLPCFPELRDDEVDAVVDACNRWQP